MGDPTTLFIETLKSDRSAVVGLFDEPEEEHPSMSGPAAEFLVSYEVNYGGADLLEALARRGVPFSAHYEDGDEYYGMAIAACDGTFAAASSPRGMLMVRVNARTLEPCAEDLEDLRGWARHGRPCSRPLRRRPGHRASLISSLRPTNTT